MYVYTEGEIRSSVRAEPFNDENGKEVVYFINTVETDDGQLTLNSKESFDADAKKRGVLKVRVRQLYNENGSIKGHKLTLAGYTAGMEMPAEEQLH